MLDGLYYGLLAIGFLLVFVPPVTVIAMKKKLPKEDFAAQIFLPQTLGLLMLLGGLWGVNQHNVDELQWQALITLSAAGSIFVSLLAAFQSIIIVRWRAD